MIKATERCGFNGCIGQKSNGIERWTKSKCVQDANNDMMQYYQYSTKSECEQEINDAHLISIAGICYPDCTEWIELMETNYVDEACNFPTGDYHTRHIILNKCDRVPFYDDPPVYQKTWCYGDLLRMGRYKDSECTDIIYEGDIHKVCAVKTNWNYECTTTQPVDIPGCPDLNQLISAWFDGDSIDLANNMWNDKSGNDQNGLLTGETFLGTSLNGEPVLNGDISDSVQFGNLNVNAKHTVFNLCKYNGENKKRIIQASDNNILFGFWQGVSGVAHYNLWMTTVVNRFGDDWVLSAQSFNKYRANGIDFTFQTGSQLPAGVLKINDGIYSGEKSDWSCAEVIIFNDNLLDETQIDCIERYFDDKYNLGLYNDKIPIIPFSSCLAKCETVDGWYDASSYSPGDNIWKDKSGNNQDAKISGTGLNKFDGKDSTNELFLNGEPSVYGDGSTSITFGIDIDGGYPNLFIGQDYTIFSLCKYYGNNKQRILQTSENNQVFGFWQGNSGVAYTSDGWITSNTDQFGDNWVLSTTSYNSYRGNGKDLTTITRTNKVTGAALFINPSANQENGDFACSEIIVYKDEYLTLSERQCIERYFNDKYDISDGYNFIDVFRKSIYYFGLVSATSLLFGLLIICYFCNCWLNKRWKKGHDKVKTFPSEEDIDTDIEMEMLNK